MKACCKENRATVSTMLCFFRVSRPPLFFFVPSALVLYPPFSGMGSGPEVSSPAERGATHDLAACSME